MDSLPGYYQADDSNKPVPTVVHKYAFMRRLFQNNTKIYIHLVIIHYF